MKKSIYVLVLTLFVTQNNCSFRKETPDRLWFFTYSTGINGRDDMNVIPGGFIDLEPDRSYTRDFGTFDYGHWELKDTLILLRSVNDVTFSFPIKYLSGKELQLLTNKGTTATFESQPCKFSSSADNPFSVENNQWRIPAIKKEGDLGIRARLRNHCRFYEIYFRWALDQDLNSIDVRSTPSLIKIYGNGFTLKEFDDLPAKWRSYFYDEEDCRNANDIVKNIFRHRDIAWVHTDNKYKMFISAFQQLQKLLK